MNQGTDGWTESPLARMLRERADRITEANCRGVATRDVRRPTMFGEVDSPLMRILADEWSSVLPPSLAREAPRASSLKDAADWLAASAMWSWFADDAELADAFADEVLRRGPRGACLAALRILDQVAQWRRSTSLRAAAFLALMACTAVVGVVLALLWG